MNWVRKYLDRNRGLQNDTFSGALERAGVVKARKRSFSKRAGWDTPPMTQAEEKVYYGQHVHSESNPLGLHTHVPGGELAGGHTHGPNNRLGVHHHRSDNPQMVQADGKHTHGSDLHQPDDFGGNGHVEDGWHDHTEENFG